jgi:hypothetical protein
VKGKPGAYHCKPCRDLDADATFSPHVRAGKRALVGDHTAMLAVDTDCSLNIEVSCRAEQKVGERIFDYLVIRKTDCAALFVEIHPAASNGNVAELIEKKAGTKAILGRMKAPVRDGTWFWLVPSSGTVCFKASDATGKRLALNGIMQPRRKLTV